MGRRKETAYAKSRAVRHGDGQIGDNGQQPIRRRRLEGQVVRDLVDGEEQVLVRGGADHVRGEQEGRREDRRVAQEDGAEDLQGDDAEHEVLGQRLGAAELEDLGGGRRVRRSR